MFKYLNIKTKKGFTFIEVLIAASLMLIIFLGLVTGFQLGLEIVGLSRNKVTATAIVNQQIELIRNLPYTSVGVIGGHPDGVLEPVTTTILNNIEFTIENRVDFVINPIDGMIYPTDICPKDYKKAEVRVSWGGRFEGEVVLVTNIAPKNLLEECDVAGGILSVSVFNAHGIMIPSPLIEIKDPTTKQVQKFATPISGQHYFALPTATYKVVVSKSGYSMSRTHSIGEVAIPEKPHLMVLDGQITKASFSIDRVSTFLVETLTPWERGYFFDFFDDVTKISKSSNIVVSGGEVKLATDTTGYFPSGYLKSTAISPINIIRWDKLVFNDLKSLNTDLKYQIYYYTPNIGWVLIPDIVLPGNLIGFDISPINLTGLDIATYSNLKLRANLSTQDLNISPSLKDWQVSWIVSEAIPIPNIAFHLQGNRIIGYDGAENPIHKYSQTHISDTQGHIEITNLKWDAYTFSIDPAIGLHLVGTSPSPQPISLLPNIIQLITLYLDAGNCLLVTVKDKVTLEPIFDATVTLSNIALAYNETQHTNTIGKTYFIPLESAIYNLDISASGYLATSTAVLVSGETTKIIKLERVE